MNFFDDYRHKILKKRLENYAQWHTQKGVPV